MSYRDAKRHVQMHYMKRLRGAKFDLEDEGLVPVESVDGERRCGGKCSDCPWRTGNLKLLLPGEAQDKASDYAPIATDVCTNPTCFKRKTDNAWRETNAKAKAQGHTLLRDGKAAQIFSPAGQLDSSEFVDVRAVFPGEKKKTWEDVLGEKLPDALVQARDPKQKVHFLIPAAVALATAKEVGRTLPKTFVAKATAPAPQNYEQQQAQRAKQEAEREAKRNAASAMALALFQQMLVKAEAEPTVAWWRWMVTALSDGAEEFYQDLLNLKTQKALGEWIEAAKPAALRALLVAGVITAGRGGYDSPFVNYDGDIDAGLLDACDFYGIKAKAFIEEKETEARIAAKTAIEKAKLRKADAQASIAATK